MSSLTKIVRAVHEIAGIAWYGEVFFITFILVPVLKRLPPRSKGPLMIKLFPRIFQTATILASLTVGAGLLLAGLYSGFHLAVFLSGPWGLSILVGGLMGLFILVMHLAVESVELRSLLDVDPAKAAEFPEKLRTLEKRAERIPRAGFAILSATLLLMIYAAHGF